jgi:hypothetical protein
MIAIKGGLLLDGRGVEATKSGVVLVGDGGRIEKVGEASNVVVPSGDHFARFIRRALPHVDD